MLKKIIMCTLLLICITCMMVNADVLYGDIRQAAEDIDELDFQMESNISSKKTCEEIDFFDDLSDDIEELIETYNIEETSSQEYQYPVIDNECEHIWENCCDDVGDYFECELCGYIEYYYIIPEHECEYILTDDVPDECSQLLYECPVCGCGYMVFAEEQTEEQQLDE